MLVAVVILCIILVCAIIAIVVLKVYSKFWEGMYRDVFKWANKVHKSDIDFAQRVIDTNGRILDELERVEQERQELAAKLLEMEKQNEEEGTIHA